MTNTARNVRGLALVGAVAALALTGCPSPSIYGTARTLPAGQIQQTAAVEVIGVSSSGATAFAPNLPTYQLRIGVADRVDLGFRVANLTSLGADAKINLVRGAFDLAIMPGVQGGYISASSGGSSSSSSSSGLGIVYLHLPAILGFNLSRSFTLLATPGIMYSIATGSTATADSDRVQYTATGFSLRLGIGANIRVASSFSIQPELTALYVPETSGVLFTGGIGFSFGAHPDYSDVN